MYSEKSYPGVHMVILGHLKHGGGSGGAYGETFGAGSELFYCLIIKNDKCGKIKSLKKSQYIFSYNFLYISCMFQWIISISF